MTRDEMIEAVARALRSTPNKPDHIKWDDWWNEQAAAVVDAIHPDEYEQLGWVTVTPGWAPRFNQMWEVGPKSGAEPVYRRVKREPARTVGQQRRSGIRHTPMERTMQVCDECDGEGGTVQDYGDGDYDATECEFCNGTGYGKREPAPQDEPVAAVDRRTTIERIAALAEPDRCPTCGSDERGSPMGYCAGLMADGLPDGDPWHTEGADR